MTTLTKYPEESRIYGFDFALQKELADGGETLSGSASVAAELVSGSGTITLGSTTISGSRVLFTISGGADGDLHRLTCQVATSGGSTIAAIGKLKIKRA